MSSVSQQLLDKEKLRNAFNFGHADLDQDSKNKNRKKKYPSTISFRPTEKEREQLLLDANGMSQSAYISKCLFGTGALPPCQVCGVCSHTSYVYLY